MRVSILDSRKALKSEYQQVILDGTKFTWRIRASVSIVVIWRKPCASKVSSSNLADLGRFFGQESQLYRLRYVNICLNHASPTRSRIFACPSGPSSLSDSSNSGSAWLVGSRSDLFLELWKPDLCRSGQQNEVGYCNSVTYQIRAWSNTYSWPSSTGEASDSLRATLLSPRGYPGS